jgi:RIO kinase 1
LEIAGKNGINVPKPIISRNNVLIMQFIGESDIPSPKAKDIPPKNPKMWLTKLLNIINVLYNKAGLIHGDLSEYNILNYKEEPYLIDMGQCVLKNHPLALKLLKNDIKNVLIWLNRLGVKTPDVEKVYKDMLKQKSND